MEEKLNKLLELEADNNRMLKDIIGYINYKLTTENNENANDFGRNVLANLISNKFNLHY